jgi:hypothetical protein
MTEYIDIHALTQRIREGSVSILCITPLNAVIYNQIYIIQFSIQDN